MRLWGEKWREQGSNTKIQCLYTAVNIFSEIHVCRQGRNTIIQWDFWMVRSFARKFLLVQRSTQLHFIYFPPLNSCTSLPLEHYKSKKAVSMNFKDRKDQYLPASPKLSFARIFTGDARAQNALCSSGDANLSFVCLFLLKDTGFEQHWS